MKHNVEWNDVKKDVANDKVLWPGWTRTHTGGYLQAFEQDLNEAPKLLDLGSETLIVNKHGIFVIFISNFKELGVFCYGTSEGAASHKVSLKI
jgi:hypothetical protein